MPTPLTSSTLTQLIVKVMMAWDSWNSTDTTISTTDTTNDTSGERARQAINRALQLIYALIKDSKYLEAYPTTALSSTANQDYIDLDPEAYLDDIDAITETTNQKIRLTRRSWSWYRTNYPDPSQAVGDPVYYIRRGNRVYLAPRPSSAVPYTIDYRKIPKELSLGGDVPLIPNSLDFWVVAESVVILYIMEDPSSVPAQVLVERNDARAAGLNSVNTSFDKPMQSGSNTESDGRHSYPYKRPVG